MTVNTGPLPIRPWHFTKSTATKPIPSPPALPMVDPHPDDIQRVLQHYRKHPAIIHSQPYDIANIQAIRNPNATRVFEGRVEQLEAKEGNPVFVSKWLTLPDASQRQSVHHHLIQESSPFQQSQFPHVHSLWVFHGTNTAAMTGILKTGYDSLALVDAGYFGKGIYGTQYAEYAHRVYAGLHGELLLNCVSWYAAFPVIDADGLALKGSSKHSNHDAHYALVKPLDPTNPNEVDYRPTNPGQHIYDELVSFEPSLVLPMFHIKLQPSLPTQPATPSAILLQLATAAFAPTATTPTPTSPTQQAIDHAITHIKRADRFSTTGLPDQAKAQYEKAKQTLIDAMGIATTDDEMDAIETHLKTLQSKLTLPATSVAPAPSATPAITPAPAALSAPPTKAAEATPFSAPPALHTPNPTPSPSAPSSISTQLRQLLGPNLTDATDLARLFPPHILPSIPPTTIPPLPPGLETFLTSPCPLLKNQGLKYGFPTNDPLVAQTHTVFLLPPLSICDWQRILDTKTHTSPHKEAKFHPNSTTFFTRPNEQQKWSNTKPTPQWIIMPKMFIPDSHSKTFQDQQRMIPPTYTLPTATQLVAQICLHFLQTGEKLYGDNYKKYTKDSKYLPYARTQDMTADGFRVGVGRFDASGLGVNYDCVDYSYAHFGVGAVLRYS